MAVAVSGGAGLKGPVEWNGAAAPPGDDVDPARGVTGGDRGGDRETGDVSYFAALVRDASARGRDGYPDGAGVVGAPEFRDDADLYACDEAGWRWGCESVGWAVMERR